MTTNITGQIWGLFSDLLVAFTVSWFSIKLVARKYRTQKWWLQQEKAGFNLIEALAEFRQSLSFLGAMYEYAKPEVKEQAIAVGIFRGKAAITQIDKAIAEAGFLIPKEILPHLQAINVAFMERPLSKIMRIYREQGDSKEVHEILRNAYVLISERTDSIKVILKSQLNRSLGGI